MNVLKMSFVHLNVSKMSFLCQEDVFLPGILYFYFFYLFQNVMIVVLGNQNMHFGRTEGLCALASFVVTEDLNNEQKSKISTSVFKALLAKGVPSSRLVHS